MLAEAYLRCNGLYVFAIGTQFSNGRIPVFRLGGHGKSTKLAGSAPCAKCEKKRGCVFCQLYPQPHI